MTPLGNLGNLGTLVVGSLCCVQSHCFCAQLLLSLSTVVSLRPSLPAVPVYIDCLPGHSEQPRFLPNVLRALSLGGLTQRLSQIMLWHPLLRPLTLLQHLV